jgi:hypothetical protein
MSNKSDHLIDVFERDRERLKKDYAFSVAVAGLVQKHFPEKLAELANGWHKLSIHVRADEGLVQAAVPRLARADNADGSPVPAVEPLKA